MHMRTSRPCGLLQDKYHSMNPAGPRPPFLLGSKATSWKAGDPRRQYLPASLNPLHYLTLRVQFHVPLHVPRVE
ncbi:hypothetical protein CKM354_000295400 [Cercospora kikuchii]|uniref:Uncharacterized protein n=1 Tax=Cercospora kikuchii TaxID=84275 RepID=A0A9P3CFP4_9PEZI|nr:uncharacterized protein CKM354_000295400 [Cercospora kikuchii]GIZ39575.1 hypothetical protein CKM354_000295400 [Cercospora kikuchii]